MKLEFKFKEGVRPKARRKLAADLVDRGAHAVHPLFPGEKDPELGALYLVDCTSREKALQLLRMLQETEDVEFAEEGVSRRLVR